MDTRTTLAANPVTTPRALRILYAEDVRQLRDLMRIVLTKDGHTVLCVADGRQALAKVSAAPTDYDLVITDHHMPNMNGLDFVTQLRTLPYAGKIVVFSSELSSTMSVTYRHLNVDRVLPKTTFPSGLRAALATLG